MTGSDVCKSHQEWTLTYSIRRKEKKSRHLMISFSCWSSQNKSESKELQDDSLEICRGGGCSILCDMRQSNPTPPQTTAWRLAESRVSIHLTQTLSIISFAGCSFRLSYTGVGFIVSAQRVSLNPVFSNLLRQDNYHLQAFRLDVVKQ